MVYKNDIKWDLVTKELLDKHLMTQEEIADYCQVSQQAVSFWAKGVYKPSKHARKYLLNLMKEFKVEEHWELMEDRHEYLTNQSKIQEIYDTLAYEQRQLLIKFAEFLASEK